MRQLTFAAGVGLVIASVLGSAPAMAQANRTYVSSKGDDSNPCNAAAPCRTFQVAHDNTNSGGEIMILDPGGYGPVNITKGISIINDGVGEAGILQSGITINAGVHDIVNLRGLTLTGVQANVDGIVFTSGGGLNVQNCVIRGYNGYGIRTNINQANPVYFNISDTIVSDGNSQGISIETGTVVTATLTRVQVINNGSYGINFGSSYLANGGSFYATVVDSLAAGNNTGFFVGSLANTSKLMVVNSQAVNNLTGVLSYGGAATLLLAGDTITGNTTAAFTAQSGGVINSFGNNNIKGNPGGDGGAITLVATK